MRLRRRTDAPTATATDLDDAWDGVPSRPSAAPVIHAPKAAELVPPPAPPVRAA